MRKRLDTVRARLVLGFALLLAMVLLLAGVVAYESYKISSQNLERQMQAGDLYQRIDDLQIDLLNMETGKRGYLLGGEESFLEPYDAGRRSFEEDLREAREINAEAGGDLVDPGDLDSLEAQYHDVLDLCEEQISARRGGVTGSGALRLSEGDAEMDQGREIFACVQ